MWALQEVQGVSCAAHLVLKGFLAGRVTSVPAFRVIDDLAAIVVVLIIDIIGRIAVQVGLEEGVAAAVPEQPEACCIGASRMQSLKSPLAIVAALPCAGIEQFAPNILHVSEASSA